MRAKASFFIIVSVRKKRGKINSGDKAVTSSGEVMSDE
jgi:hypothetical protein